MSRTRVLLVTMLATVAVCTAQLKVRADEQPKPSQSIIRSDDNGLMFGFFDPNKLVMRQSYSLSYTSFGSGQGMSLGMYTNSMFYQISNPLTVQFDVSLMHSPFGGVSSRSNDFTGIHLTRAELNYRPADNVLFQIQYRQIPSMYSFGGGYGTSSLFMGGLQHGEEQP